MGNAKFWFYPMPAANHLVEIDMGEGLAELFSEYRKDIQEAIALNGSRYRTVGLTTEIITIQRDRMVLGETLASKFRALQNHLDRGYMCSFCSDSAKAWIAPLSTMPLNGGSASFDVMANPFQNIVGTNIPTVNDYLVMETGSPASVAEQIKISAISATAIAGGLVVPNDPINFTYKSDTWVRYYRFWPCLKRPAEDAGRPIITNEHGALWSLELRLVVDWGALYSYHPGVYESDYKFPFIESGDTESPYSRERFGLDGGVTQAGRFSLGGLEINKDTYHSQNGPQSGN